MTPEQFTDISTKVNDLFAFFATGAVIVIFLTWVGARIALACIKG